VSVFQLKKCSVPEVPKSYIHTHWPLAGSFRFWNFLGGSVTLCVSHPPLPSIFSDYSFLVHHPVNRINRHLLAHALAFDVTVTWQFSQREQSFFHLGSNSTPLDFETFLHASFLL
jgi:hypothetical protein